MRGQFVSYLIVNGWKVIKEYDTLRGAKISYARKYKKIYRNCVIISAKCFYDNEPEVDTVNMMSGKKVKIKASLQGGCCDPGTERYWTM